MKRYFGYNVKNTLVVFLAELAAFIVFYNVVAWVGMDRYDSYIYMLAYVLGILCAVAPIWTYSYRTNARQCDLYFSLPISRTKILATRFWTGFLSILAAFTISWAIGAISGAVYYDAGNDFSFEAVYYVPLYFASIIPAFSIYAVCSFLFTRANTILDGIFFVIMGGCALCAITGVIYCFAVGGRHFLVDGAEVKTRIYYVFPYDFFPGYSLDSVYTAFNTLLRGRSVTGFTFSPDFSDAASYQSYVKSINELFGMILTAVLGFAAAAGMMRSEKNAKAENAGRMSASLFGYKTMVPLYMAAGIVLCGYFFDYNIAMLVVAAALCYGLDAIYHRSFKIGLKRGAVICLSAAAGIALLLVLAFVS